jgi:hypothetical protein
MNFWLLFFIFTHGHCLEMSCATSNVPTRDVTRFFSSHIIAVSPEADVLFECSVVVTRSDCSSLLSFKIDGLNNYYKVYQLEQVQLPDKVKLSDFVW